MDCAYCKHVSVVNHTSLPLKYKCSITGDYHYAFDDCDVDFEPVKHGRWIMKWHTLYRVELPCCSVCNKGATFKWDYCPNCGAKMDLDEVEND